MEEASSQSQTRFAKQERQVFRNPGWQVIPPQLMSTKRSLISLFVSQMTTFAQLEYCCENAMVGEFIATMVLRCAVKSPSYC